MRESTSSIPRTKCHKSHGDETQKPSSSGAVILSLPASLTSVRMQ